MSPSFQRALFALSWILLAGSRAAADDLARASFTFFDTSKLEGPDDHSREVVPARPDFTFWDGRKFIRPPRADAIFIVEREEGERVVIRERTDRRVRGWAAARDLVPLSRAESFFSARIQADERLAFPYLIRSVVRDHLGQTDRALADLDQAVRIDPSCAAALERRGWILGEKGGRELAEADVQRAILLEPRDPRHLFTRASLHQRFDKVKPELAIADLDQAIRLDPSDPDLYMMRALGELTRDQYREGLGDVKRAMELGGQDPKIFLTGILVMIQMREYRAAREAMARQLRDHPDDDLAYQCRILEAMIDIDHWMFPFAMLELRRAIALDPGKEDAYILRSVLRGELGFPPWKVRQDLDAAIRANPRSVQARLSRSAFWYIRGDYAATLADLDAAVRLAPNDAGIHGRRALLLATCPDAKVRNGREAVASATRACELSAWKVARHVAALAAAQAEAGNFRAAVATQEKAIGLLKKEDFHEFEYRRSLDRYKAGKPNHRLGLLEEWGIRTARQATP